MKNILKQLKTLIKTLFNQEDTVADYLTEKRIAKMAMDITRANRVGLQLSKDIPEPFLSNVNLLSNLLMAMNQVKENFPHIIEEIKLNRTFDASVRDIKIILNRFDRILSHKLKSHIQNIQLPVDLDKIEKALLLSVNGFNDIGKAERDWLADSTRNANNVLKILQKCASVGEEEGNFIAWLVEQSMRRH